MRFEEDYVKLGKRSQRPLDPYSDLVPRKTDEAGAERRYGYPIETETLTPGWGRSGRRRADYRSRPLPRERRTWSPSTPQMPNIEVLAVEIKWFHSQSAQTTCRGSSAGPRPRLEVQASPATS